MRIPTNRSELKGGEWFAFVLSKIAPLEWWAFHETIADVTPDRYRSESSYQSALYNTWEFPRFCFRLFRPSLESVVALQTAVEKYEGPSNWWFHDFDCIGARRTKPTSVGIRMLSQEELSEMGLRTEEALRKHNESLRKPPTPAFLEKAIADIPVLCSFIEKQMGLTEKVPEEFDSRWPSAEGLAQSRGEFEDFFEPGLWSVFLTRDPETYVKNYQATSPMDRSLGMGMSWAQWEELFQELGADLSVREGDENTELVHGFPLLSRFDDVTADITYAPNEVGLFLEELRQAQQKVKGLKSIRGLDNLVRIARWAEKLNLGIYFGGV